MNADQQPIVTADEIDSDYILGKCEWCGDETQIYRDNMYCEECDISTVFCKICDQRQHSDSRCRHVFRDDNLNWNGSGIGEPDETIKSAFLALLTLMPVGFAPDLKVAINSGIFHTFIIVPLIGDRGTIKMTGMPDRDGRLMLFKWGDDLLKLGDSGSANDIEDGYHWLASLYDKDTSTANLTTMVWIDEWLASEWTKKTTRKS
jgi:hypothetical protein